MPLKRKNVRKYNSRDGNVVPIELVNYNRTKSFFAMLCARGLDLRKFGRVRQYMKDLLERTFSISAGMSSARRSFSVTDFEEVDEKRIAGTAVRSREERD